MQNKYPLWKYVLLLLLIIAGLVYAIPNLYPEDPAIEISAADRDVVVSEQTKTDVIAALQRAELDYKAIELEPDSLLVRFNNTDNQLSGSDILSATLGDNYTVALNLAPSTPRWLSTLGAHPMKLGLDLRGGVHFLLDVDFNSVVARRLESLITDIRQELREARIRYTSIEVGPDNSILIRLPGTSETTSAFSFINTNFQDLTLSRLSEPYTIQAKLTPAEMNNMRTYTIEQTMTILRNRVNELGVSEAVVQQQGTSRVSVDLPGIQDAARAKQILGGTATLEFHLVDVENDAYQASQTSIVPIGSQLFEFQNQPILLKRQVILSGESITSAISGYDPETGMPAVNIRLGGGDSLFSRTTRANIGKPMAIIFAETKPTSQMIEGTIVRSSEKVERVISVATIESALGNNFQIRGIQDAQEARDLALLLRAGALPAPIYPVEERTVGPTLGKENIQRGLISLEVGMALVLLSMVIYYRLFGLFADVALVLNLIILIAVLSIIGATLTMPGIAGIVLTVGMAVDANVLIYERIREELRNGVTPQAAIFTGYQRAFSTIVDANITTLIVALILFAIGSGPIKGFAITLSFGLLTSMLTSIIYTRGIVNLVYGGRTIKKLSIGIKQDIA